LLSVFKAREDLPVLLAKPKVLLGGVLAPGNVGTPSA
jgi:hypothetical protein